MLTRKTKILATVGPSSESVSVLVSMIQAGVNVFRMNFSHGDHAEHAKRLANIRAAIAQSGQTVGILQDISGPKIRIGKLSHAVELMAGETLLFSKTSTECTTLKGQLTLGLNRPEVLAKVAVGDAIYLYDGKIRTRVTAIDAHTVTTRIENRGVLSSNKGVNFPNTRLGIDVLTEKDKADILWGIANGVDFMAISFVQTARDIEQVREYVKSSGGDVHIYAKIEKFDAVENIDEIILVSDGIMVARGDLGIETPYYGVPLIQKEIIAKANDMAKPVITATQMLISMTENEMATRAEISDVANAVLDGTDAVMLSEETAVGLNPAHVVHTMAQTIMAVEQKYPYGKHQTLDHHDDTDIIMHSMTRLAQSLNVEAVFALTGSGRSAVKMSRYRIKTPIITSAHDERVMRRLTMVWGLYPFKPVKKDIMHNMLGEMLRNFEAVGLLNHAKTYIAVAGYPAGVPGTTNFMRILKADEINHYMTNTYLN
ncbi:MAG: pyruvate kinase [Sulfuricurvum sp. PC08-66]|nr:MAG: pyruvate kinase [Sulfuricurvum sp. PC08-66]